MRSKMEKGSVLLEWLLVAGLLLVTARLALNRMHIWHERFRFLETKRVIYDGEKAFVIP